MPTVRLEDAIIPEVYADYQAENSPEKTAFYESGVAVRNERLDNFAGSEGGDEVKIPFWKDLDADDEPNNSSDDPAQTSTPSKIGSGKQVARTAFVNKSWSTMDLTSELAGDSPMERIASRTGSYWQKQWQRRLISSTVGLIAQNVAVDAGDMTHDAGGAFTRTAFTSAAFTLGDAFEDIGAIGVHSVVLKRMVDNDDVEDIRDSEGRLVMRTYLGRRIIVDDSMPLIGAAGSEKVVSVLFGAGSIGYGEGSPEVPVEVDRKPESGNGAGQSILYERKTWILHPAGYEFTSNSVADNTAARPELEDAVNWKRVVDRKNVPLAFLLTTP